MQSSRAQMGPATSSSDSWLLLFSRYRLRARRMIELTRKDKGQSSSRWLRERRRWWRGGLGQAPAQLECPQAVAALRELEAAATAQNCHVLLAVDLVGRHGRIRASVGLELPQEIAIV